MTKHVLFEINMNLRDVVERNLISDLCTSRTISSLLLKHLYLYEMATREIRSIRIVHSDGYYMSRNYNKILRVECKTQADRNRKFSYESLRRCGVRVKLVPTRSDRTVIIMTGTVQ